MALFWPGGWAYCRSVPVRLDGYQTASQWELLPAGNRPGSISTVGLKSVPVYLALHTVVILQFPQRPLFEMIKVCK